MTNAFVLMTAMPPTKGHINLVSFAAELDVERVHVLVCTQPGEPFVLERWQAVAETFRGDDRIVVHHLNRPLEQNPDTPGFWEMWDSIMQEFGFKPGDYAVSSEAYGATLAERNHGIFMPYDPSRELYYTKATKIRTEMTKYFHDIAPAFQHNLRSTITVFGAESTGKTTLSKEMSYTLNGHWLFEWARPYLETVGPEITVDKMIAIWKGQLATQNHARYMYDKPFVIQDTDLFSTIGYWEQPHWKDALGSIPEGLIEDALATKSDLYVITRSNIPFEPDNIRYGIDKRESPDEFWLGIADKYGLDYVLLDASSLVERNAWACKFAAEIAADKSRLIEWDRMGL